MLTEKEIKHLQEGFDYLEEYDKLLDFPDKKVKITATISLRLKRKLENSKNQSEIVEKALIREFNS